MANGVWVYTQDLLGSGATALLQDCVAREIFDIYMNVGYPSPAQGTVTFPSLSGFVPDSEIGITCTSANVTTILATLASVDSRLKLWAWFGTWSSDNGGGDDALGHQNAKISINTPTRRSALITAIMTVANWGFYGIQDDTEDLNADSLEASGQYGATYITFTNDLATAAHAAGKKYIPFVPSVWYNFSNSFLQDLTVPDAIIMAGHNDSDIGQWNTLAQLFFDKAPRPVIYNFGWPAVAPTMTRLNSLPFSGVASKIVGYSWYLYSDWYGNWGIWDTWRSTHPSVSNNRSYEINSGGAETWPPIVRPTKTQLATLMKTPQAGVPKVTTGSANTGVYAGWGPAISPEVQPLNDDLDRLLSWFVAFVEGTNHAGTVTDVQLDIGPIEHWVNDNGTWSKNTHRNTPEFFQTPDLADGASGLSVSTVQYGGQDIYRTGLPSWSPYYAIHGWGGFKYISKSNLKGQVVAIPMRLVGVNANNARVIAYAGSDQYAPQQGGGGGTVIDATGWSKFIRLSSEWQWVVYTDTQDMARAIGPLASAEADKIISASLPGESFSIPSGGGGTGGGGTVWIWDGKKIPDSMRDGATAAANVAANGSKNAAFRSYIKNAIGNGFRRKLLRDGVLVWEATDTGYLPENGNAFELDATVTQISISNADIDSGTWIHRIENLSDSTKFIATSVTPIGGGGAMTLSGDLVAGGQLVLGMLTLNCPTFDTGSTGVPGGGVSLTLPSSGEIAGAEYIWNDFTEMTQGNTQALLVTAGSPLDMSWVFSINPTSAFGGERLLGTQMSHWNWPDAASISTYVNHVKRMGVKLLRFQGAGLTWGGGTMYSKISNPTDLFGCWYNPSGIDTMKRYFAKMSDAGVKYILGIYGNGNDFKYNAPDFWSQFPTAEENTSFLFQVGDTRGQRHWEACFDILMLGTVSHFNTPKQIIDDTNLVAIDIINENNLDNGDFIAPGCAAALSNRYWNSWRAANGNKAFMEYLHTMHKTMYAYAKNYASTKGYSTTRKLTTNNYIPNYLSSVLRAEETNISDIHLYHDLCDDGGFSDWARFHNQSIIGNDNYGQCYLFPYFVWNQTSLSTEWGMGGPNIYGYENALYGAMWSFQGGNWINQFCYLIQTLYPTDPNVWGPHFNTRFYQGHDATKDIPQAVAFRAAVFMFQRGDVTEATTSLGLVVRKSAILNNGEGWSSGWPRNIVLLANFVKIRMVKEADVNGSLQWIGSGSGPTKIIDPINDSTTANRSMTDWITWLKTNGLITNDNTSDASIGRYENATKEIRVTRDHKSGRVKSAKSHMVIWDNPTLVDNTDLLIIENATPKGMVSVHDIGTGTPGLTTTNKMLLMTCSMVRSKNTGNNNPASIVANGTTSLPWQNYSTVTGYKIQDSSGNYGYASTALPVKVRGSIVIVKLKAALGTWAIYRLDIRGNRVASVPYEWTNDNFIRFVLDNTSGAALMQTAYYELIKLA